MTWWAWAFVVLAVLSGIPLGFAVLVLSRWAVERSAHRERRRRLLAGHARLPRDGKARGDARRQAPFFRPLT